MHLTTVTAPLVHIASNAHGSSAFGEADNVRDSIVLVFRGRVTLDKKELNCSSAGAKALIIIDVTGDPIGPDLDDLSSIIVGSINKNYGEDLISLLDLNHTPIEAQLCTEPNLLGFVLSHNYVAIHTLLQSSDTIIRNLLLQNDQSGHCALHYASSREDKPLLQILELLLSNEETEVDKLDYVKYQSALHIACNNGCAITVHMLILAGASMFPRRSDKKVHTSRKRKMTLSI
jgi:hypothetical protein